MSRFPTLRSTNIAMGNPPFESMYLLLTMVIYSIATCSFTRGYPVPQQLKRQKFETIWHPNWKVQVDPKKMGGFCHRPGGVLFEKKYGASVGWPSPRPSPPGSWWSPTCHRTGAGRGRNEASYIAHWNSQGSFKTDLVEKHREEFSKEMLMT